ncbi:hypothetical protein BABINDRAFT_12925 [Babjeviella inositovora NRRL Y-12698]|uniref:Dolichyl-diphosphooligosaccharide-protein glycosyltransferase subunit OST5 n=1 Tax=Babjeviella inositovora NRRL Y-12698 TaxID=984486 RepID=A0A1E3QSZ9_9ASCO|nr:uncharacterized protein BABINDRAFT_12925 [Babjeviella inositovora NRRL Y-12698]ODQ80819.1 hypothetical protein BABINDRAFT_12925 [Babjeviella inositovora NRRL Y-12698]
MAGSYIQLSELYDYSSEEYVPALALSQQSFLCFFLFVVGLSIIFVTSMTEKNTHTLFGVSDVKHLALSALASVALGGGSVYLANSVGVYV